MLIATTNPGKVREIRRALGGIVRLVTLADLPPLPEPDETGLTFAENAAIKARVYARATGLPTVAEDSGLLIDALEGRPGVQSARYPGETYAEKFRGLYAELAGKPRPWTARFVCALAYVEAPGGGSAGPGPDLAGPVTAGAGPGTREAGPVSGGTRSQADGTGPLADGVGAVKGGPLADALVAPGATPLADAPLAYITTAVAELPLTFTTEGVIEGEIVPAPRGSHGFGYDPIFFYPPFGKTTGEMTDEEKLTVSHRGQAFRQFREWLESQRR